MEGHGGSERRNGVIVVVGMMRAASDDGSDCFPGSTQVTAAALDRRRRG